MRRVEAPATLITGCSSGIGRALVGAFVERGHRVLAMARDPTDVEALAGGGVRAARLDVTEPQSIAAAVDALLEWTGRVDVVVNNAGYGLVAPLAEVGLEDLRAQLETNLIGMVAVTQAVLPRMLEQRWGRVVNIGSVSGVTTTPFGGAYSASKAAVHMVSDAMRMELAPFGIQVVTVQPGAVDSRFGDNAMGGVEAYRSGSLYSPVYDSLVARVRLSQNSPTPADSFARGLVRAVTKARPPAVVRMGRGSRILPLLALLPAAVRDRVLSKRFGLDRLQ